MNACNFRFDLCPLTPAPGSTFASARSPQHTWPPSSAPPPAKVGNLRFVTGAAGASVFVRVRVRVCDSCWLLVLLLSPRMLNAGNTFQPAFGFLRAGFITLGVRKIKIVPLSQKHAQQYTHTHTHLSVRVCVTLWKSTCCGKLPKKRAGQAEKQGLGLGGKMRKWFGEWLWWQFCQDTKCAVLCSSPRFRLHNQSCYPCFAYPLTNTHAHLDAHTHSPTSSVHIKIIYLCHWLFSDIYFLYFYCT